MRRLVWLLLVAGAAGAAHADSLPRPDIKEWKLDNGLEVVYLGVHKAPVVSVQVWYHVGSKEEPPGLTGSAHMFEHIMFKGSTHVRPEEHARLIDYVGGTENAFTMEDATAFHEDVPGKQLDFAVQLEAERMRNLVFQSATINPEREVVKEEKRQRVDNNPIFHAIARLRELAYTKHPYHHLSIGTAEDLDRLTPGDLKKFYDEYYQPNNATLIVVGDVSEDEVRATAQKWFGPIPAAAEPPRPAKALVEPPQKKERKETVSGAQVGVVIGGYHIPGSASPDMYPLRVLEEILGDGNSSRMHKRVVRQDQIGVAAGGTILEMEDPGLFAIFGAYLTAEQEPKLEAALLDEIAKLQNEKVSDAELEKAKNQLAARFVMGLESAHGIAMQIGISKIHTGDPRSWLGDYDKLRAVTADDVQRVAKQYLGTENLTLVVEPPVAGGAK
jgi:zinc protease